MTLRYTHNAAVMPWYMHIVTSCHYLYNNIAWPVKITKLLQCYSLVRCLDDAQCCENVNSYWRLLDMEFYQKFSSINVFWNQILSNTTFHNQTKTVGKIICFINTVLSLNVLEKTKLGNMLWTKIFFTLKENRVEVKNNGCLCA